MVVEDLGMEYLLSSPLGFINSDLVSTLIWALVLGAVFGGAIFWFIRNKQYKYGVIVFTERTGMVMPGITHRGRLIRTKDGTPRLFVSGIKKSITVPSNDYVYPSTDKRYKQGVFGILKLDSDTFTPVKLNIHKFDEEGNEIKLVPLANDLIAIRELDRELDNMVGSQDFWSKHGQMVIAMTGSLILVGAAIFIVMMLVDNFHALNAAADALREAAGSLNSCNVASGSVGF
jgi:hypothetical protein